MTRFSQEVVVFWAALFYSGFATIGAERNLVSGNSEQEGIAELALAIWLGVSGVNSVGKVMKTVESSLEGDPFQRDVINEGGALHQCPDKVISHQVHEQLFAYHGRRQTTQHVHAKEGFNLAEMEFHSPTPEVEPGQLGCTKAVCIQQGSNQDNLLATTTGDLGTVADQAKLEGIG